MSIEVWLEILKTFGLAVFLVMFYLWQSISREKREEKKRVVRELKDEQKIAEREEKHEQRFSDLDKFCRNKLVEMHTANVKALEQNTVVLKETIEITKKVFDKL